MILLFRGQTAEVLSGFILAGESGVLKLYYNLCGLVP